MHRTFQPTSLWQRALFGVAGVFVTVTILTALHTLAAHYEAARPVLASAPAAKIAQR